MRKVTASAVILTALTGCNQGGIPSAQWSFEVPPVDETGDTQSQSIERLEQVEKSEREGQPIAGLSADAQPFASGRFTAGDSIMGPAFEQPDLPGLIGAGARRDRQASASETTSRALAALSLPLPEAIEGRSQRSVRLDPVAQVQSYLRSGGDPGALVSRVPVSSSVASSPVSLPSALAFVEQSYQPGAGLPQADLSGLPVDNSQALVGAAPDVGQPAYGALAQFGTPPAGLGQGNTSLGTAALGTAELGTPVPDSVAAARLGLPAVAVPANVAELGAAGLDATRLNAAEPDAAELSEGLPVLTPGVLAPTEPVAIGATEAVPVDVPIGTAILQDLQRSSGLTAFSASPAEDGVVSTESGVETVLPNESFAVSIENRVTNRAGNLADNLVDGAVGDPAGRPTLADVETEIANAGSVDVGSAETTATDILLPSVDEARPTLERLMRSMPPRERPPLLTSYRSVEDRAVEMRNAVPLEGTADSSRPLSESAEPAEFIELPDLDTPELRMTPESAPLSSVSELDVVIDSPSPLLDGLRATAPLSAVYVPISEAVAFDPAALFLQDALVALRVSHSRLSAAEVSAAEDAPDIGITKEKTLGSSRPKKQLGALPVTFERLESERSESLRDAGAPSNPRLSQRRQRIVWM